MMKRRNMIGRASWLLGCLALMGALFSQAAAAEEKILARERAAAVIDAKGPDEITLTSHEFTSLEQNRLEVPYNPTIYDVDGKAILLQDLKIPCDAIIEYKWVRGKAPELIKLEVQKIGEKATTIFTLPKKPAKQLN